MNTAIDALTSPTLKHLRERWWNDEFTEFIVETLEPRPGNRILDVGCGEGTAAVSLRRLQISQLDLVGVDIVPAKLAQAKEALAAHNYRASLAAADVCRLPFRDATFDALYFVAVLQHVRDLECAVEECARVTRPDGRMVGLEPDNRARYFFSSTPAGERAFESGRQLFAALAAARGDTSDGVVGPKLPGLFAAHGVEPTDVRCFPVSQAWLGDRANGLWPQRHAALDGLLDRAPTDAVRALGLAHRAALEEYESEARAASAAFVEIQHTMLFATVGVRPG